MFDFGTFDQSTFDAVIPTVPAAITGTLVATEAPDVVAINALDADQGALATTESSDVAAFAGNVGSVGTLATTEAPDVAAFAGAISDHGTLATTESPDVVAINALDTDQGVLATTEAPDVAAFAGDVSNRGTLATTESPDVAAFTGAFAGAATGTLATTEAPDIVAIAVTVPAANLGDGGPYVDSEKEWRRKGEYEEKKRRDLRKAKKRVENSEGVYVKPDATAAEPETTPVAPATPQEVTAASIAKVKLALVPVAEPTSAFHHEPIVQAALNLPEPLPDPAIAVAAAAFAQDEEDAIMVLLMAA